MFSIYLFGSEIAVEAFTFLLHFISFSRYFEKKKTLGSDCKKKKAICLFRINDIEIYFKKISF